MPPSDEPAANASLSRLSGDGIDKGRLEALTDGIVAVAMTLLVLDIKLDGT